MKKSMLIILSFVMLLTLSSGGLYLYKRNNIKKIVWEQLDSKTQEFIKGSWRSSSLSKVTLTENMGNINDESYIGKEVYIINYTTKHVNSTRNTIGVFISIDNFKIIGVGNVD